MTACGLFYCYVNHRWGMWCDVIWYAANVQAPLFCYQLEAAMRLRITVSSIQEDAQRHGIVADQIASWVCINERALHQRYAQELEEKCTLGMVIFAKGDLILLIRKVGEFDWHGPLWDSLDNLQRMAEMQDNMLE